MHFEILNRRQLAETKTLITMRRLAEDVLLSPTPKHTIPETKQYFNDWTQTLNTSEYCQLHTETVSRHEELRHDKMLQMLRNITLTMIVASKAMQLTIRCDGTSVEIPCGHQPKHLRGQHGWKSWWKWLNMPCMRLGCMSPALLGGSASQFNALVSYLSSLETIPSVHGCDESFRGHNVFCYLGSAGPPTIRQEIFQVRYKKIFDQVTWRSSKMAAQYTAHGLELHRILLEDVPVTNLCKSMVFQDEKLAHWLYLLPMVFPSLLAAWTWQ